MSGHQHHHQDAINVGAKLKYGLIITCVILVLEVAGGILSNSLALLSDAGHVLADGIALLLSWYGVRQARKPPSSRMTYGYHRVGVVIAIINGISILAISGIILYEAYQRFFGQHIINSALMLIVAAVGLAANVFVALWLHNDQKHNLNIRSAFWHAAGDALASVGVIAGAIVIMATGLYWVDAVVSILIAVIILVSAFGILREGFRIILEGVPRDIMLTDVVDAIKGLPEVKDVHDIHVWSLASKLTAMSSHIVLEDCSLSDAEEVRRKVEGMMLQKFGIGHTTIQMECGECGNNGLLCRITREKDH